MKFGRLQGLNLVGTLLLGVTLQASAGVGYTPPPTIWNAATPVAADGWLSADIPYALVHNRLMFCDGQRVDTPSGAECHQTGTTYTKPTFFVGGRLIPGSVKPFITPQEYLNLVATRHPEWHQKLVFSAIGVSLSNRRDTLRHNCRECP